MEVETGEVIKVFERKVWIESDIMGDQHVMVQHMDGKSEPFNYCSFFYDYGYTSNATIKAQAEKMAISIGGKVPLECRVRSLDETLKN